MNKQISPNNLWVGGLGKKVEDIYLTSETTHSQLELYSKFKFKGKYFIQDCSSRSSFKKWLNFITLLLKFLSVYYFIL